MLLELVRSTKIKTAALGIAALMLTASSSVHAQENPVVLAAASLKNALDDINSAWTEDSSKQAVISYASSSALAKQIEEGAPADIFISADLKWMEYLSERDHINPETEIQLLGNRIVLIAASTSDVSTKIEPDFDLAGLLGNERLAMGNVDSVPAGRYGKAALEALGVWDSVSGKVAQAENVRAAMALVSLGEAPLGIVYETDAAADDDVKIVDLFPENTHAPIIYPAALTADTVNPAAAEFLAFLRTEKAKALFEKQGFTVLLPTIAN